MKVAVIGGTGFIGAKLVARLRSTGHDVVGYSPTTGLDLLLTDGLVESLAQTDLVVNSIDAPSFDEAAIEFFGTTSQNLLAAAERAGVNHLLLLSIVGIDHVPDVAYYRGKLLQERVLAEGPIPYSIVRATQFMEFVQTIMSWTTDGDIVRLPTTRLQPIAAADVVATLADVGTGSPINGVLNVAGPDVFPLDELGRLTLKARPDGRRVVADPSAGLYAAVSGDAIIARADARITSTRYVDWIASAEQSPG